MLELLEHAWCRLLEMGWICAEVLIIGTTGKLQAKCCDQNEHQKMLQNASNVSNFENSSVTWLAWFWCVGGCAPTSFLSCSQFCDLHTQKPWPVLQQKGGAFGNALARRAAQQSPQSTASFFRFCRLFVEFVSSFIAFVGSIAADFSGRWGSGRSFYITIGLARFLDSSCPNLKKREVMYFEWGESKASKS